MSCRTAQLLAALLLSLSGAGCPDGARPGPVPKSVLPPSVIEGKATQISVQGERFLQRVETDFGNPGASRVNASYSIRLGEVPLRDVTRISDGELRATVPAGMGAGSYDLEVTDPWGERGTLSQALTVLPEEQQEADPVAGFRVSAAGPQVAGTPFAVDVVAVDDSGNEVESYSATLTLSDVTATLVPAQVPLVHGRWAGAVEVRAATPAEVVSAEDERGHRGQSATFRVEARPVTALCFTTPPRRAEAGQCSEPITLQSCDDLGNPALPAPPDPLDVQVDPPGVAAFFADPGCATPAGAPRLDAASGAATVYLRSRWAGGLEIRAGAPGLREASQREEITPSAMATVAFVTRAQEVVAGACSQEVVVELQDYEGNPVPTQGAMALLLTSDVPSARFFLDAACTRETSETSVPAGEARGRFWFSAATAGQALLRVGRAGLLAVEQPQTVLPDAPVSLAFASLPLTVTAGTCSEELVLQVRDRFGNPAPVGSALPVGIDPVPSAGVRLFPDSSCLGATKLFLLAAGESEVRFAFTADHSGSLVLSASAPGLSSTTQLETVVPAEPHSLVFANPPALARAGECAAFPLQSQDLYGNPSPVRSSTPIALATDGAPVAFFSDAGCTAAVAGATLSPGASEAPLFVRGTRVGVANLEATVSGWSPAQHVVTIQPDVPAQIVLSTAAQDLVAGTCSPAVTAQVRDRFDNPSPLTAPGALALSALPAGSAFFVDAGCLASVNAIGVAASSDQATFYFKATRAGAASLTATLSASVSGALAMSIVAAPPSRLALVSQTQTVEAGACSAPVEIESRDAYDNPSAASADTVVSLVSMPSARLFFFGDAACANPTAAVTLPAGSSRVTAHFTGTAAGTTSARADAPAWVGDAQLETIIPGPTRTLRWDDVPTPRAFDTPFTVVVRALDLYGNPTPGFASSGTLSISPPLPLTCVASCSAAFTTEPFANGVWTGALAVGYPGGLDITLSITAGGLSAASNAFDVIPPEAPPIASFTATPVVATVGTAVTFDASASWDGQTRASDLEVSWDLEGSASGPPPWTAWATQKLASHSYEAPGTYSVVLAVRDGAGTVGYTARLVRVLPAGSPDLCTVTTTAVDLDDGASSCSGPFGSDGKLSLREAVKLANAAAGTQVITFAGAMTLTRNDNYALTDSAEIYAPPGTVFQQVFLVANKGSTLISGLELAGSSGMLRADPGGSLTLVDVWVHDGQGVKAAGSVTLERTRLENCTAECLRAEGDATAVLTVRNSEIWNSSRGVLLKKCNHATPVLDLQSTVLGGLGEAVFAEAGCFSPALIRNNTFFEDLAGIHLEAGTGHQLRNNVFEGITGAVLSTNTAKFAVRDYHTLHANGDDSMLAGDPQVLLTDPRFVDPARFDLRLQLTSPCRDTASAEGLDLNGVAPGLWFGSGPDRGGRETW